jgi:hypothetical protein
MRKWALLLITLGLVATACGSSLGRSIIECELDIRRPSATSIISAQAVPSADFLPCIEALRPGWDYNHVAPESGRVWFALDSDRLGDRFVQVTLTEGCEIGNATPLPSELPGADFYIDVIEDRSTAVLTIIPIAARHRAYAFSVAAGLSGQFVEGHRIEATVDDTDQPASDRIDQAVVGGGIVVIVDDIEVTNETLSIREPDGDEEAGLTTDDVVEELEGILGDPVYRASWFYVFDASCIRYDIDAEGPGAERAARDISSALGFYDLTELKDLARRQGIGGFE